MLDPVLSFTSVDEPFLIKNRGWVYTVEYPGPRLEDKTSYVQQLMRDGCILNGKHVMPVGIETFAVYALWKGAPVGILLKEREAG